MSPRPPTAEPPPYDLSLRAVYARSLRAYRDQATTLLVPAVVLFGVVGFPAGLLQEVHSGASFVETLLGVTAALIGAAALLMFTGYADEVAEHDHTRGGRMQIILALRRVLPVVPALAAVSVLYELLVAGGLLLLIAPGVWFAARFSLCTPAVTLAREGPLRALRTSWRMSGGRVAFLLAAVVAPAVFEGVASSAGEHLVEVLVGDEYVLRELVDALLSIAIAPLVGLQMAFVYLKMRPGLADKS